MCIAKAYRHNSFAHSSSTEVMQKQYLHVTVCERDTVAVSIITLYYNLTKY